MLHSSTHPMTHQTFSPWGDRYHGGQGGPETTHGSKSSKSRKEDKKNSANKTMLAEEAAVWLFPRRWPNGGYLFYGVRIRSEGVFWKAIWENQMKRLVLKNE